MVLLLRLLDSDTATTVTSAAAAPTAIVVPATPAAAPLAPAPAAAPLAPAPAAPPVSSAAMALAETASRAAKTNAVFFMLSSFLLTQLKHNTEKVNALSLI
ncbi:translation initiation factor III [Aeromonas caviae]|nr:translation initiation factor III [Aeromonas caviae]